MALVSQRIFPFSEALTPLFIALILIALAVKPSPYRRLVFVPIALVSYFVVLHTTSGTPVADYGLRLVWLLYLLFASDYIVLTDVQRRLHRVLSSPRLPEDDGTDSSKIEDASTWQRIKWAADLFTSPRGVNWAHEPRFAIPPHLDPSAARLTFILWQLLKVVVIFVIYDLTSFYVRSVPAFGLGIDSGIATLAFPQRIAAVLVWGALGYCGMALQHYLLGILCVAVHLTGPEEWPAFFGGVGDAWSVRSFWGFMNFHSPLLCIHP
jgi:hypothetical protein